MTTRRRRAGCRSRWSLLTSLVTRRCGRKSSGSSAPARCRRSAEGAAGRSHLRRDCPLPGEAARPGGGRASESGPHGDHPAADAHRVPERRSRSPRARRRRRRRSCPADESSYGFDNVTVGDLSPTLLDRYLSAAEKISRIAVGRPSRVARRRDHPDSPGPDAGGPPRRACRSARAAAPCSTTPSRWTASTRSRFG